MDRPQLTSNQSTLRQVFVNQTSRFDATKPIEIRRMIISKPSLRERGLRAIIFVAILTKLKEKTVMRHRPWWILRRGMTLYLAGLTAIFFSGCATKAQQSFDRPPAPVTVATVVTQDVPTYLDAIGKTVARELVAIQPQVSGRIVQIHFTDGADVKKNDMLFTIDTRPLEATLRQAQANLSKDNALKKQAEANLTRDIAQAKWGEVQAKRYLTLVEQGVVSREQYEQLRTNADSLNASAEADRAAVGSADEAIKVDQAAIDS